MTERRLPPALEENWFDAEDGNGTSFDALTVKDVLDWLYGEPLEWRDADGAERHATTPGLVERVRERVQKRYLRPRTNSYEDGVLDALRAELGMEPWGG